VKDSIGEFSTTSFEADEKTRAAAAGWSSCQPRSVNSPLAVQPATEREPAARSGQDGGLGMSPEVATQKKDDIVRPFQPGSGQGLLHRGVGQFGLCAMTGY
jgi:hypothetical protein